MIVDDVFRLQPTDLSDLLRDRQTFQPTELRPRKLTTTDFPLLAFPVLRRDS
jgi:hypothetical protein